MLAIIGGSALASLPNLVVGRRRSVRTPHGKTSAPLTFGTLKGRAVVFLARHGDGHTIPPHEINYRANLWALHSQKVRQVVAIATVGGIREDLAPGTLAIPDQIIDYTHGRKATFFGTSKRGVTHIDFTQPYSEELRQQLLRAARAAGEPVAAGGTYAATQGPRLETAAEIDRLARDGAHMVGMTGMPEAVLARELGLDYAALVVIVNQAAGRGASAQAIHHADMAEVSRVAMTRVCRILEKWVVKDGG
jgi:5'-deoxy-5'-methylthioadenosine phosphorylase